MSIITDITTYRVELDGSVDRETHDGMATAPLVVRAIAIVPRKTVATLLRQLADRLEEQQQ